MYRMSILLNTLKLIDSRFKDMDQHEPLAQCFVFLNCAFLMAHPLGSSRD